ncbi:ATP-grasp domain-containing protein [Amycolatopsis sp., V23-08]|uniref:ATP-grasp domain-containing protein n=1 Tax=Amycolatopsis heterodermiae TaxID=3110235 RepID=A0ABU5R4W9_9PSEU|nr:ATP-grasp domain-containing protein [Amycolatopsis sp., V23-08]MEA5361260.1 ATP-grasp domain-containing protein [Amycolatopsis sp., V23-08]
MRTLLLVESNTTGTGRLFARRARELGYEPVLAAADPSRYPYAAEDGVRVVQVDTTDPCAVLAADIGEPAGVTTSSEYFIPVAARIAAKLGLPGPDPDAVTDCRNKAHQRAILAAMAPKCTVVTSVAAAVAAATEFPVVLKPAEGSGSVGVLRCETPESVASQAAALLSVTHNERGLPVPAQVLVEPYASGPEYSVELFGDVVVAVVRKRLGPAPFFVEVGHDAPASLPPSDETALADTARAAVSALGLGFGAAHVEIRLTPDGPRLMEVNPRLAGGMIPELVRAATGVDLVAAQVAAVLGVEPDLRPDRRACASLRFLTASSASVLAAGDTVAAAAAVPGVVQARLYRPDGTSVRPARDYRDRAGHVLAVADRPRAGRAAAVAGLNVLREAVIPERETR